MTAQTKYLDEFATIEDYWHFDQLCQDLARHKARNLAKYETRDLTSHEIQVLQGILLGYSPQEIASLIKNEKNKVEETKDKKIKHKKIQDKTVKSEKSGSIRGTLSRNITPWVESLVLEKLEQNADARGARIPVWLERAGYRKALMHPAQFSQLNRRIPQYADDQSVPQDSCIIF
jgi:hypothetical protein